MVVVESIQPTGGRQHVLGPARLGAKTAICVVYGRTDGRTYARRHRSQQHFANARSIELQPSAREQALAASDVGSAVLRVQQIGM
jgi:hypothetical protein